MKMYPIYNNVGRLLGHVESKSVINGHDGVTVCEDVSVRPYDPDEKLTLNDMTTSVYRISKRQICFRNERDNITHRYLVTDYALPDWFWKNLDCVEFKPEHFEKVPW